MMTKFNTLKDIDKGITQVRKLVSDRFTLVQNIAVAIIAHAAGAGAGDVSRALTLVKALPNTDERNWLMRYFQYFGSIGIDLNKEQVRMLKKDNQRSAFARGVSNGYDLDGARQHNWYEPFDKDGNRATWYVGPQPGRFQPNTLYEFGENIINFADRTEKQLDATKTVGGAEVPVYDLTTEQRRRASEILDELRQLGRQATISGKVVKLREEGRNLLDEAEELERELSGEEIGGEPEPVTQEAVNQ